MISYLIAQRAALLHDSAAEVALLVNARLDDVPPILVDHSGGAEVPRNTLPLDAAAFVARLVLLGADEVRFRFAFKGIIRGGPDIFSSLIPVLDLGLIGLKVLQLLPIAALQVAPAAVVQYALDQLPLAGIIRLVALLLANADLVAPAGADREDRRCEGNQCQTDQQHLLHIHGDDWNWYGKATLVHTVQQ